MWPGATILCTGTASCNNRCKFRHNWHLSQRSFEEIRHIPLTPEETVEWARGFDIVNLVVTTLNDDMDDIRRMCQWIRDTLSDEVPLHFNRFFPAYKLTSLPPTPVETLESAAHIADEEGLQYVYIGNTPGHERNSTFCPKCGEKIIQRSHFAVLSLDVEQGKCRFCGHRIPGIWRDA